jgi:thymidine kinase
MAVAPKRAPAACCAPLDRRSASKAELAPGFRLPAMMPDVEVIYGCMNSGKTTELLRRVRRYRAADKRVELVNHASDNRYGADLVSTHDKVTERAHMLTRLIELEQALVRGADVIAVNEAQFFEHLAEDLVALGAMNPSLKVILAGLVLYSNGNTFGELQIIIPWARSTQLYAVCRFCKSDFATMTACTKVKKADVTVGASEVGYAAACYACWARHTRS